MKLRNVKRILNMSFIGGVLAAASHNVLGSVLYIPLTSVSDFSSGRAGSAAAVFDAGTNFLNAAGLTRFKCPQLVVGAVATVAPYRFSGTMTNPGALGFAPTLEKGRSSSTSSGVLPSIHFVSPICEDWAFGFSIVSPYGLGLNYKHDSLPRYEVTKATQESVDFSPSLAYRTPYGLSIGVGADILYYHLWEREQVRTQPFTFQDSKLINKASRFNYGWHAGLLYEFTECTRVGVAYRSQYIMHLKGRSRFSTFGGPPLPPTFVPSPASEFFASNLRIRLPLASITTLSAYHEINSQWTVMGTVEFMNWSVYKKDRARNIASPTGPTKATIVRRFRNTWYYATGVSYQVTDCWIFRTGVNYTESGTRKKHRSILITDGRAIAIALGSRLQLTPDVHLDVGYNHAFIKKVSLNNTNPITGNNLKGHVKGKGDLLGLQLAWDF